ncbi:MAG: phosphoglucosamine mutase [Acidimicrobiia bacterium]|nr:phosphoglucosamine mutase [Acidimicrobiia bacterium]
MAPRFGTDGVRGVANEELTAEVALALGRVAVEVLCPSRFIIGRDTRRSGPMLEAALVAGVCSAGADAELLGVVPTPAVAWASADRGAAGAMISASHNPFADNGIKLFGPGGLKLADSVESQIENALARDLGSTAVTGPTHDAIGTVLTGSGVDGSEVEGWLSAVSSSIAPRRLDGLSLVVDCANGAATGHAARVYSGLGAIVRVIGDEPDGVNINDGVGSTSPAALAAAVLEAGADLGLAFDGDADRLIAIDETGAVVDGDRVLAILATDWSAQGRLAGDTVVVTVMTNLGFHLAMQRAGIQVVSTAVGDRYVLEALDERQLSLGGEQSGHVICRDLATTGDGLLTGVQLADALVRSGEPLSKLATEIMTSVPQVLRNVRLPRRDETLAERLRGDIERVEEMLGADGRVLVRASGTEPLLRIMVEHVDPEVADRTCEQLVSVAERLVGSG